MHDILHNVPIAFDLDGTLVDTAPDLVRALNETVGPAGLRDISIDEVRPMVGRGSKALIRRAFEAHDQPISETDIRPFHKTFLELYAAGIADRSKPFEGVIAVLETLKQSGALLSVCTNKPGALSRLLLSELGMSDYFERIIGADDTTAKKPDPQHLIDATGGVISGPVFMIGDSEPDYLAAKHAGAFSVLFTKGYSEKPVHTLGADRLFDHFHELPSILLELIEET